MTCCKCNKTGRCVNCSCVKAGIPCQNCLPSRLGSCSNPPGRRPRAPDYFFQPVAPDGSSNSSTPLSDHPSPPILISDHTSGSLISTSLDQDESAAADLQALPAAVPYSPAISDCADAAGEHSSNSDLRLSSSQPRPEEPPVTSLPDFMSPADPTFVWGSIADSTRFCSLLKDSYEEVVHWKKNCFKVPLGNAGKSFVAELSRLYDAFSAGSALESIALMASSVLPILVLQNPYKGSKAKVHISCLERRMILWHNGDLLSLVKEGRSIQQRLPNFHSHRQNHQLSRSFANQINV